MEQKLTEDELAALLVDAATKVQVGASYQHYKGNMYTVLHVAITESNNQACVVYRAQYDERLIFTRPLTVWLETVTQNGQAVPRFTKK